MKKIYLVPLIALISVILFSSLTIASFPPWSSLPRLDVQYFQVIKTEAARIDALTVTETVDYIPGPGTTPGINTVEAWGANMSVAPSASYGFCALQCRHVWPPEAAGGTEGKTPGQTVSPMNYSSFRLALSYIFGMEKKNTSIWNYYLGPQTFGLQQIIPPAQGFWCDKTAKLPTSSNATAWALMQADGFYVSGNTLYDPRGVACRDLTTYASTGATAWEVMVPDLVANFNNFMDNYLGVTNCNLNFLTKDFETLVYGNLLNYHDYDMIHIGLTGLGDTPDWVIDMFHSREDYVWGWNFAGVHDDYIDHLMRTIETSLDVNEIKQATWDFQHYFNGEMPASAVAYAAAHPLWNPGVGQMPHYLWTTGATIQSYHPALENFIQMPCYGSEQCEVNWAYLQWNMLCAEPQAPPAHAPGAVKRAVGDEPGGMNPFYENTLYGWLIGLDGCCEGLLRSHPLTLETKPWLAKSYAYEPRAWNYTTPSGKKIVNGMKIDVYIREGVYWQDTGAYEDLNDNDQWDGGEPKYEFPFTSYDCKFAADMLMKYQIGRYASSWRDLVEVSTEGPYKFTVWYNASSYWKSTYFSSFSFFPQHIYQKADKQVEDGVLDKFGDFYPYSTSYEDWMGIHPPDEWGAPPTGPGLPGYWSALVGTGPFIFGYYNVETLIGATYANTRYWGGASPVQQSLETGYEKTSPYSHFVKEYGSTMTLENTTYFDPTAYDPTGPGIYWHETAPVYCENWRLDGWKDLNGDGEISACDEVSLSWDKCGNGQWVGMGEYHVVSLVLVGNTYTMVVEDVTYIPKYGGNAGCGIIVVDGENMVWWHNDTVPPPGTDVYYELTRDAAPVTTGWVMGVDAFDDFQVHINTAGNTPGLHTWTVNFYVRTAGTAQEPEYTCSITRTFYYYATPWDGDQDGDVDIFDCLRVWRAWGSPPRAFYDASCDFDCDGDVDVIDALIQWMHYTG